MYIKGKKTSYMSAHVTANGQDFHCTQKSAEQIRKEIIGSKYLLLYPIRLEDGVTWVHWDVYNPTDEHGDDEYIHFASLPNIKRERIY